MTHFDVASRGRGLCHRYFGRTAYKQVPTLTLPLILPGRFHSFIVLIKIYYFLCLNIYRCQKKCLEHMENI